MMYTKGVLFLKKVHIFKIMYLCDHYELEGLARMINTKLFACFAEWERINPAIMAEPGRKQWNRNLKKILLLPEKLETTIKKIRNRLFQYLQMDLKNITEYEFSF